MAYRKGFSIKAAVLKVYSDIVDAISNEKVDAISNEKVVLLFILDLTAAFDMVDHDILLQHLERMIGFSGLLLNSI